MIEYFTLANTLSWIGNVLIVIGLWKVGDKTRKAFLFSIAGETLWTFAGLLTQNYALSFICAVFCVMAARNFFKWGQDVRVG